MAKSILCSVDGCERPKRKLGLCAGHYSRLLKHGDVQAEKPIRRRSPNGNPQKWILELVKRHSFPSECITWPFGRGKAGYGVVRFEGLQISASRAVLIAATGRNETDKLALHKCGKGHLGCVNPGHLRWGTEKENSLERWRDGTMLHGETHSKTVLTLKEVEQIWNSTESHAALSKKFGVSNVTIRNIRIQKTWKAETDKIKATNQ